MTYNNDWKPTENNMPDTFHPTPQTPEQIDEGLRAAFRQAKKDGVMDATPYLKQMTETDISKVLIEGEYATIMGVKYKRVEEPPSPVAEAYKDWWGQYPELETDSEYDDMRWQGFQAGFKAAYEEQVREDDYYDKVVDKLVKEPKPTTLYDIIAEWCDDDNDPTCEELVNRISGWLPKEHDTNSDGWNKCVRMIRENLR